MSAAEMTTEPDLQEIACQSCGAALTGMSGLLATICPYCASPSVIQRPPSANRPRPTFAIGFAINQERATELVKQWLSRAHWFARSDFKRAAPDCTRGVYLPAYLYGAVADTQYSASIGENYTETETYTTTDSKGKPVTRTRTVTKTEWRSLTGHHSCYVLDVIVTASQGTDNDSLEAIEPFDLRALRRYSPSIITGWLAELPSKDQTTCFKLAHAETVAKVGAQLKHFLPGDSHRNLQHRTQLSREVIDLTLLPIWCFAVRYDANEPPVQILVNGQTGRVAGDVPTSTTKVALVIGAVLLFIAFIVLLFAMQ